MKKVVITLSDAVLIERIVYQNGVKQDGSWGGSMQSFILEYDIDDELLQKLKNINPAYEVRARIYMEKGKGLTGENPEDHSKIVIINFSNPARLQNERGGISEIKSFYSIAKFFYENLEWIEWIRSESLYTMEQGDREIVINVKRLEIPA